MSALFAKRSQTNVRIFTHHLIAASSNRDCRNNDCVCRCCTIASPVYRPCLSAFSVSTWPAPPCILRTCFRSCWSKNGRLRDSGPALFSPSRGGGAGRRSGQGKKETGLGGRNDARTACQRGRAPAISPYGGPISSLSTASMPITAAGEKKTPISSPGFFTQASAGRTGYLRPVIHLWHPEAERSQLARNEDKLADVLAGNRVRALRGLSSLQGPSKTAARAT